MLTSSDIQFIRSKVVNQLGGSLGMNKVILEAIDLTIKETEKVIREPFQTEYCTGPCCSSRKS